MGRPIAGLVPAVREVPPEEWPAWVLAFGGGIFPVDCERQARVVHEFRVWRRARDTWRREHTTLSAPAFIFITQAERRRRRQGETVAPTTSLTIPRTNRKKA